MVGRAETAASAVRGHRESVTPHRLGDGNNLAPMVPRFIPAGAPPYRGLSMSWGLFIRRTLYQRHGLEPTAALRNCRVDCPRCASGRM